ncbi:phosphoribosyl-ATP pyrophosphatase [mine drainage metagenome]|uniref:phosphoribosyl-ATP diphosphatase n=1 Tax=mine drainage metagenome TaxID=410659 RepID=A0A1J5RXD1_9ZZZZ
MSLDNGKILDLLYQTIVGRKGADPDKSYTAKLFTRGLPKISQKVGEEAVETVIAALAQSPAEVASESADLFYHLLVLWAEVGVTPAQVWAELAKRQGMSGIDEKKSRKK